MFTGLLFLLFSTPAPALDLLKPFSKLFGGDEGIVIWQAPGQYVKVVDQDWDYDHRRAPENIHPIKLKPEDLAIVLAALEAPDPDGSAVVPLFTRDEILLLADKLSEAFDRSQVDQDVVFGVYDNHGNVVSNSRRSTGCRMFYHNGEINMIFGDVLQPVNSIDDDISHYAKPHRAGRRMESNGREIRVATGPGITYWEGRGIQRKDWILIDMHSTIAAYRGPRLQLPVQTVQANVQQPLSVVPVRTEGEGIVTGNGLSAENRRLREELARARKRMQQEGGGMEAADKGSVDNNVSQPVITQSQAPGPAPVPARVPVEYRAAVNPPESSDIVQKLSTLKTLCDKQLITNQECDAKRKEILDQF